MFIKILWLIDFSAFSLCFFNQVSFLLLVNVKLKCFYIGQVWGNLISYLVLKPKEKQFNETLSNEIGKYSKCGADFSEKEYKGAEVVNQIERKTVGIFISYYYFIILILD